MSTEAFHVASVRDAGLSLGVVEGPGAHVSFTGAGETGGVEVLRQFVASVHAAAVAAKMEQVHVDLVDLKFINSSCLKVLVSWVYDVDTNGRPYQIELIRDTTMHWQKGSLDTLRRLAPEVVSVVDAPSSS